MLIGYARTSTLDQKASIEAQARDLRAAGCEKLFQEQVSSVDVANREQLALTLDFVREGDALVVTKLDRLARSVAHLITILDALKAKGASLRILNMGIDTATPTGKLMLTMLAGVAEFEREIMLERQREGIAKAKAEGKYKGRKPTAQAKADEVMALKAQGVGASEIAKRLGIGRASVYRIIEAEAGPDREREGAGVPETLRLPHPAPVR
ncbi:recombinase family protein [Azospirillum canadense]|uniref:recombinase family protein n=1 Tax=Azospirillum canadense TaxID=403962 RepID=UPI002225B827|nr:recombinase family protein [Azospirillum canadense]MCW2242910.1 DNA invertase Pin-like site-specific DNA recombinase [Azospirillum canadense]